MIFFKQTIPNYYFKFKLLSIKKLVDLKDNTNIFLEARNEIRKKYDKNFK